MTIPRHIVKAHATGNDFVLYVDPDGRYEPDADEVRCLCDRHFGIGADGLIRLAHPCDVSDLEESDVERCQQAGAQWFMDYRNADGSIAEMCGNGTRAITLLAQCEGIAAGPGGEPFLLGTRAGVKTLRSLGEAVPYGEHVFEVSVGRWQIGPVDALQVSLPGLEGVRAGTFVDMGNPHVVVVLDGARGTLPVGAGAWPDVEQLDLSRAPTVTPALEHGQNVEFVRVDRLDARRGVGEATMRVYERGCGETLSCGTGLCATAVTLRAKTGVDQWDIRVRGGVLHVAVSDDDVKLTGDACLVANVEPEQL